jgi:hypothetical protein
MNPETYDIFKGHSHNTDAQWIITVEGFYSAREEMEHIAAEQPGAYFLFCASTRSVVAETNSTDAVKKIKSPHRIWQEQDGLDAIPENPRDTRPAES